MEPKVTKITLTGANPGAYNAAIAERIETERLLAGAVFMSETDFVHDTFERYGFSYALVKDGELREFIRRVEQDGQPPSEAAFSMRLELELVKVSQAIPSYSVYLPIYTQALAEIAKQEAAIEAAQRIGTAALNRDQEAILDETAGLLAMYRGPEAENSILLSAPADHAGHAAAVLALHPNEFLYADETGWLAYDGLCWRRDGAGARVRGAIVDTLTRRRVLAATTEHADLVKACRANNGTVTGVEGRLADMVHTSLSEFDKNPELFNCANGVYNMRTGELTPHNPDQRFTWCSPVDYDPNADTAEIEAWIRETVINPEQTAPALQVALGYSFTGETAEEKFFYVQGPSRSGKGTLTELIEAVATRSLYTESDFSMFTRDSSENPQNFDLAPLKAARIVTASESEKGQRINSARIKRVTGGNDIYCAFKGHDFFSYRPQFKIWLTSNFDLSLDVRDDAAWGRVVLFIFPHSHLGHEDITLKSRLKTPENLRAFLKWALDGARIWYDRYSRTGMPRLADMQNVLQEVRNKQDSVLQWLVERTEAKDDYREPSTPVYQDYRNWCEDNGYRPRYQGEFSQELERMGYPTRQSKTAIGKNLRHVFGLRLVE
jgi:putative DNA primase/helicase